MDRFDFCLSPYLLQPLCIVQVFTAPFQSTFEPRDTWCHFFPWSEGSKPVGNKGLSPTFPAKTGIMVSPRGYWGRKADEKGLNYSQQERTGQTRACCPLPGSALAFICCKQSSRQETWLGSLSWTIYVLLSITLPSHLQVTVKWPLFHRDCAPWKLTTTCSFIKIKHPRMHVFFFIRKKKKAKYGYFPLLSSLLPSLAECVLQNAFITVWKC